MYPINKPVALSLCPPYRRNRLSPVWLGSSDPLSVQCLRSFSIHPLCCIKGYVIRSTQMMYRTIIYVFIYYVYQKPRKSTWKLTVSLSWQPWMSYPASEWSWSRCIVPFQTGRAVWRFQTISPQTVTANKPKSQELLKMYTHWPMNIDNNTYHNKYHKCHQIKKDEMSFSVLHQNKCSTAICTYLMGNTRSILNRSFMVWVVVVVPAWGWSRAGWWAQGRAPNGEPGHSLVVGELPRPER